MGHSRADQEHGTHGEHEKCTFAAACQQYTERNPKWTGGQMIPRAAVFTRSRSSRTLNDLTINSFTPAAIGRRLRGALLRGHLPRLGHGALYEEKPGPFCITKSVATSHRQVPLPGIALGRPSITETD